MEASISTPDPASVRSLSQLDRLLITLDVDVQSFALCQVQRGRRLIGESVNAIMVHYVLTGTHYLTIAGHDPVDCPAGSIVLIPPALQPLVAVDREPAIDVQGKDRSTLTREGLLMVDATAGGEPDLRYISGIVHASFSGSFGLLDNLTKPIAQHVGDYGIIRDAFSVMVDEVGNPSLGSRALTSALMKTCLVLMIRRIVECGEQDDPLIGTLSDKRLGQSIAAVLDRPAHPHTTKSLAQAAGMSRSSFCQKFAQAFGVTPMEFVAKTRLHHAAQMLRSTPLPVKLIVANVGYSSRSQFSRAFRIAYGEDPSAFRSRTTALPTDAPKVSGVPRS